MEILKFAAIDIGSNAVRLLFVNVVEDNDQAYFKKSELIRMPVRLGEDAFFGEGIIRSGKIEQLMHTIQAFKHLMIVQDVVSYRACATSAMREAANSSLIVEYLKDRTGVNVEVIDGKEEAELVYSNRIVEMIDSRRSYFYVDVGGGSTEITLFSRKKVIDSASFNLGTIRFLKGELPEGELERMRNFLTGYAKKYKPVDLIGSGGNINRIFKLSGKKEGAPLSYKRLKKLCSYISGLTTEEMIRDLGFNPDRADVIIPAGDLFLKIMKWSGAGKIIVPKIGIPDGIVRQLYKLHSSSK